MQSAHGINKFLLCKKCSVYFPVAELNQHRMACGKNINNEILLKKNVKNIIPPKKGRNNDPTIVQNRLEEQI